MTKTDLASILSAHALWLTNAPEGKRADLRGAELFEACKNLEQALADVINAAGNGQPYSATELVEMFVADLDQARAALAIATEVTP